MSGRAGDVLLIAALLLSGCGTPEAGPAQDDPSKLSAELEAAAQAVETRADEAVAAAEAQAAEELRALNVEAAAAAAGDEAAVDEPAAEAAAPTPDR